MSLRRHGERIGREGGAIEEGNWWKERETDMQVPPPMRATSLSVSFGGMPDTWRTQKEQEQLTLDIRELDNGPFIASVSPSYKV